MSQALRANGVLTLDINSQELTLNYEDAGAVLSKHTGRTLRRLRAWGTANEAVAQSIVSLLSNGSAYPDTEGKLWSFEHTSSTYRAGEVLPRITATLQEHEQLIATGLVLARDLRLSPTKYDEELEDDQIVISLRVLLTLEDAANLHDFDRTSRDEEGNPTYFDVIREGISDVPIRMRFGRILWRTTADGHIEFGFALVAAGWDDVPRAANALLNIPEPDLTNVKRMASGTSEVLRMLLEVLVRNGQLTDDQKQEVYDSAKDAYNRRAYEFQEVEDLENFGF